MVENTIVISRSLTLRADGGGGGGGGNVLMAIIYHYD